MNKFKLALMELNYSILKHNIKKKDIMDNLGITKPTLKKALEGQGKLETLIKIEDYIKYKINNR